MAKTEKKISINSEKCKGCELCAVYCPRGCLKLSDSFNSAGNHPVLFSKQEKCTYCGTCYLMCPDNAIEITTK